MSDTVKIAIGVSAVAIVGYFVVTVVLKPNVVPRGTAPSNTTTQFTSGIVSGIAAFGALFKTSAPPNAPLKNIDVPLTSSQQSSIAEFNSESPDMTDAQRDAAIFG